MYKQTDIINIKTRSPKFTLFTYMCMYLWTYKEANKSWQSEVCSSSLVGVWGVRNNEKCKISPIFIPGSMGVSPWLKVQYFCMLKFQHTGHVNCILLYIFFVLIPSFVYIFIKQSMKEKKEENMCFSRFFPWLFKKLFKFIIVPTTLLEQKLAITLSVCF